MGLGIILRLTATGQHVKHRKLIPTRAVDKMLLDILPGDRVLVGQDFPLVTKDFDMQPLPDSQGILVAMMSRENREKMTKLDSQVVRVDVITLLLSYLPLEGCTMTRYCFPGWSTEPGYRSVYTFWEGRLALQRALRDRTESGVLTSELYGILSHVRKLMDQLEQKHPDDWYIRLDRKRVSWDQTDAMQDVKEVFAWTQTWLKAHTYDATRQNYPAYANFVAVHAY
jgi:hypothetical protein